MSRWTVNLCDAAFGRLHEVEAGRFSGVSRLNAAGQWRLEMPFDEIDPAVLPDIGAVLVFDDAGLVRFAGYVSRLGSAGGGVVAQFDAGQRVLLCEGRDVWDVLARRVVFPDPSTFDMSSAAYDTQTGQASTIAAHFINSNAGSSALPDRQIPGLTVSDPTVGLSATWAGRLQPLDVWVGQICDQGEISCVAGVDADLNPRFVLRDPVNRSNSVVFSDIGDLSSSTQARVPAEASWVLAAGQGEGDSRAFESAGSATGLARVELVTEQSNATTTAQLQAIADATLRDLDAQFVIEGSITDAAARQWQPGVDYLLGDTVGFNVDVLRVPVRVTSITTEVSAERSVQLPVFGRWTPDRLQGLRRDVLGLAERFNSQIK